MPIYEYVCTDCNHAHDALQKISDAPLTDCPACSEPALKKMISAPRFRLKGSGWYETDFKSTNQKNLADSGDKKSTKPKESDASGKKESSTSSKKESSSSSKKEASTPKAKAS